MKSNRIIILINKPISKVFKFTVTPPNSTLQIDGVVKEEVSEWPVRIGTVYKLTNKGNISNVIVKHIKKDELVEWISEDDNYHCRYTFKPVKNNKTEFTYYKWVDKGEIDEPFTLKTLNKLKLVIKQYYKLLIQLKL